MRSILFLAASLAMGGYCAAQEADVEQLLPHTDPRVQQQIASIHDAFARSGGTAPYSVEVLQEMQALNDLVADKGEIVKQMAIFAATEPDNEERPLIPGMILIWLDVPRSTLIRELAPYLSADNANLRSFVRDLFEHVDNAVPPGRKLLPLQPVNYKDYVSYVGSKMSRNEEIPGPFVEYIYERAPGRALLVFQYGSRQVDAVAQLHAIRKKLEATRQGQEAAEQAEARQQRETRQSERREILLAEYIVSNAIWLKENEFSERFQAALPEANAELTKLAKHKEWWARLYVAYIMRQHPELRDADVLRQLSEDRNELVSEAATPTRGH